MPWAFLSRLLAIAPRALIVGGLCLVLTIELYAQNAVKGSATSKKQKPPVRAVQGTDDDDEVLEAPPPEEPPARRPRTSQERRPPAESTRPKRRLPGDDDPVEEPDGVGQRRPARPHTEPLLKIQKLSPELEQILKDWEKHSSKVTKLAGGFIRLRYDSVWHIEFRGQGTFAYSAPDKGSYNLQPMKVSKGDESNREGYEVQPDEEQAARWVCDGKQIIKINDKEKQFEKVAIPPEKRGQNIIDGPLPFLFGMKAEQAKKRYFLELGPKTNDKLIFLKVRPREDQDALNYSEADVIIDRKTFLPTAVMLTDPTKQSVTVHRFEDVQINASAGLMDIFKRDPFNPNLKGYQQVVLTDKSLEAGPAEAPPRGNAKAAGAAGGAAKGRTSLSDQPDRDLPRSADASGGAPRKKAAPRNTDPR